MTRVVEAGNDPASQTVTELVGELRQLAAVASHRPAARDDLQRRLHWLHFGRHEETHIIRQWLASTADGHFEATAEPISGAHPATDVPVRNALAAIQEELSPLKHPCSTDASHR